MCKIEIGLSETGQTNRRSYLIGRISYAGGVHVNYYLSNGRDSGGAALKFRTKRMARNFRNNNHHNAGAHANEKPEDNSLQDTLTSPPCICRDIDPVKIWKITTCPCVPDGIRVKKKKKNADKRTERIGCLPERLYRTETQVGFVWSVVVENHWSTFVILT